MAFENATILRGTFEQLKVRYRHTAGVLFLWRKKDTTKLYIQSHPFDDLSKLVESNWSCVFFGTLMVAFRPNLFTHLSHLTLLVHHLHHLLVWILMST